MSSRTGVIFSHKSVLSEFFQGKHLQLPMYHTVNTAVMPTPLFECTIMLYDGSSFSSGPKYRKKDAEEEAAKLAYEKVCNQRTPVNKEIKVVPEKVAASKTELTFLQHSNKERKKKTIVYIDLEGSQHHAVKLLSSKEKIKHLHIFGVYCVNSSLPQVEDWGIVKKKCITSTCSDAVDIWITMQVGILLMNEKYVEKVYVISKDNFSGKLEIVANTDMKSSVKVKRLTDVKTFIQEFWGE